MGFKAKVNEHREVRRGKAAARATDGLPAEYHSGSAAFRRGVKDVKLGRH